MHDDDHYHTRSPHRGRAQSRERDNQGRRDGRNRSRQGYSRSPASHDFRDDSRARDMDCYYDDDPRDSSRHRRRRRRDEHDYTGMYDDNRGSSDYRRGHHDEEGRHYRDRRGYHDRDDPGFRSLSRGHYSRSQSLSPVREAGRPSDTVILEGLPLTVSASELEESILRNSIAAEFPSIDVRVSSAKGHRRAFVQFESIDCSIAFIREHFPKLLLDLSQPTDEVPDGKFDVYVHYARSRDDTESRGPSGVNWTCPSCDFSNYPTRVRCKICSARQSGTPELQQSLTGLTDAADGPSQILVVYPLAGFVNEDMLAADMKRLELEKPNPSKDTSNGAPKLKSTAPTGNPSGYGARPGSLHRVFLMRDVHSNESFKYGFAEFWTLEDATAAMAKFRAARTFTVAACAVNVSAIHMGVFLPEERELRPDIERMSFYPLFNPSLRVRYRDLRLYPSEQVVTAEPPSTGDRSKTAADDANESKKPKKRKADGSLAASTNKRPVMAGQMAMWQRKHDELHGQEGGADREPDGQGREVDQPSRGTAASPPKPDANAPIKISLSGAKIGGPPPTSERTPRPNKTAQPPEPSNPADPPPQSTEPASYVDRDRLMCLICMRKYKSVDEVNIHERSRNHRTATENEELVRAALPRLAARDKRLQKQQTGEGENTPPPTSEPQYRDRAKERRQAYSQPKKPTPSPTPQDTSGPPKKKKDERPQPKPPQPLPSKGAGMLAKMGWTTGAGLGANGEGRTEVVETNAYQEGVGLGAEGGNLGDAARLAERKTTNSYAGYVSTVQDKARERYSKME